MHIPAPDYRLAAFKCDVNQRLKVVVHSQSIYRTSIQYVLTTGVVVVGVGVVVVVVVEASVAKTHTKQQRVFTVITVASYMQQNRHIN